MKAAIVLVACVVYVAAFTEVSANYAAAATSGVQCFPQRCQACRESFAGESIATYDCAGKCGLCDLCVGTMNVVPDCDRWCQESKQSCTDKCNRGKALCLACSGQCGLF